MSFSTRCKHKHRRRRIAIGQRLFAIEIADEGHVLGQPELLNLRFKRSARRALAGDHQLGIRTRAPHFAEAVDQESDVLLMGDTTYIQQQRSTRVQRLLLPEPRAVAAHETSGGQSGWNHPHRLAHADRFKHVTHRL